MSQVTSGMASRDKIQFQIGKCTKGHPRYGHLPVVRNALEIEVNIRVAGLEIAFESRTKKQDTSRPVGALEVRSHLAGRFRCQFPRHDR